MNREYRVSTVREARAIGEAALREMELADAVSFGLPEIDDRYHIWRVPLKRDRQPIGEIVINAKTRAVDAKKSTSRKVLEARLRGRAPQSRPRGKAAAAPRLSTLPNTVGLGDSEALLAATPAESVDLVFTSPPYFNARPEYADYAAYGDYLEKMRRVIRQCARVLNEGRFFVLNVSPVLLRRGSRSEASTRLAVPFDFHRLFMDEGFEFIDDIIWQKPAGAGWATGRGRRFAADRNPLQYKPVPVTEYVLAYRKKTDRLIDWHIRKHPDQAAVADSKIGDGYEATNIWKIHPAHSKDHPAVFPEELAARVIQYYSFKNDVVLDPFGGIGTVARAAHANGRRFASYEINPEYVAVLKENLPGWFQDGPETVRWLGTPAPGAQ